MSAHHTFKVPDAVRDVLARSTITATSVKLPEGQLERKLYTDTNKVLEAAGGKWNKKSQTHEFAKDPREALGIAVTEGKATNTKTLLQAFYTPKPLAERVARAADLKHGHHVLEPSMGGGALKPGGVLVAIMWPAWQAAKTKTAEAFRELVASAAASDVEDIEAGTFEDTAVRTIMLTMHKAGL